MASGFFMLLDDIATILDDVAVMSKIAAKKSAGVLGDDLALNAEQVAGVAAERELPVVWAVAKGSLLNKLILIPMALVISSFVPQLITPLLMLGGLYLCFEGIEKVGHKFLVSEDEAKAEKEQLIQRLKDTKIDLVSMEKEKIKGAIRTDFILSAEIVVLTLGIVAQMPILSRIGVLLLIGIGMTVGVYGLVGAMVKVDDLGFWLIRKKQKWSLMIGQFLLVLAPKLMKFLSVAGTVAMFLVGGGIFTHGIPFLHHFKQENIEAMGSLVGMLYDGGIGFVAGSFAFLSVFAFARLKKNLSKK